MAQIEPHGTVPGFRHLRGPARRRGVTPDDGGQYPRSFSSAGWPIAPKGRSRPAAARPTVCCPPRGALGRGRRSRPLKPPSPITIADYDPSWPAIFLAERDLIYATCGRDAFVRIEHIGSTAVPGLAAKPVIDIMPGLRSLDDAPPVIEALQTIGYEYVPEFEHDTASGPGMPFRRYFRKDRDGRRAFHLHMVAASSDFWRYQLRFRNWLRYRDEDREAYARLKHELAERFNERLRATGAWEDVNTGYTDSRRTSCEASWRRWRQSS